MTAEESFDIVVIGGGPSGQKAAVQAAKMGKRVLVVDQGRHVGGECVYRGTIPSKTLRETAVYLTGLQQRCPGALLDDVLPGTKLATLMQRVRSVLAGYGTVLEAQLDRNNIARRRGKVSFIDANHVKIEDPRSSSTVRADQIIIATGSRPRTPDNVPVDHENILDSDSILSLIYLPKSIAILGGGVIASEFASVFSALGTKVTMIDKYPRPLGWMDTELTDVFMDVLTSQGTRFVGDSKIASVRNNGMSGVRTELESGEVIETEKLFCAQGRSASVRTLHLANAGVAVDERGFVQVNDDFQTAQPHIYAVGDVIGPPALAATAMEQGRLAMRHALGLGEDTVKQEVPLGIYTVPEMSSVGLTEAQAIAANGSALVGRAKFAELSRGQISGNTKGLMKLISCPEGKKILGAHIVGEGATELIHVAQMAMMGGLEVDVLFEAVLNFPTLAEAYRVAALEIYGQRQQRARSAA